MMWLYVENTIFTLKMSSVIYARDLRNKSQFIAPSSSLHSPLAPPLGELAPKATERAVGIIKLAQIS